MDGAGRTGAGDRPQPECIRRQGRAGVDGRDIAGPSAVHVAAQMPVRIEAVNGPAEILHYPPSTSLQSAGALEYDPQADVGKSWLPGRYGSLGSTSLQVTLLKPLR